MLAHDRDIRDLMGARDLYIAEVYDVARVWCDPEALWPRFLHKREVAASFMPTIWTRKPER